MANPDAAPMPVAEETWVQVDAIVQRFEAAWQRGEQPSISTFLPADCSPRFRQLVLNELVAVDLERRLQLGEHRQRGDYLQEFPDLPPESTKPTETAATVLKPPPDPSLTGFVPPFVLGQYQVEARIGKGGMGMVYRAVHTRLKRPVAVKILPPESTSDPRAIARFQREMEAVGLLDHPNIVRATDAGEASGVHFLVMELLEGIDLHRLVRLHGPLPVPDACELVRQAAKALQCAHEHGLVHRDIKPSNLLLTSKGILKVLDLGLALLNRGDQNASVLTASGLVMGTADYMAPEQWEATHDVDIHADVYSLGCTLYTLLAGRPPFGGSKYKSAPQKMAAHLKDPVRHIREQRAEVPVEIEDLVQRMTAKKPSGRPSTPGAVAEALQSSCSGADLVALITKTEQSGATGELETRPNAGDAVTISRLCTPDASTSPERKTRQKPKRARRWLIGTASGAVLTGILLVIVRPWSATQNRSGEKLQDSLPADTPMAERTQYIPGKWHNLLERAPIPVLWTQIKNGSHWNYNREQQLVTASCLDRGLLKLGEAPAGRYDLEIDVSQHFAPRGVGLFFRGRSVADTKAIHLRVDALLLVAIDAKWMQIKRSDLDVFPEAEKASGVWLLHDTLPRQSARNRLKITVGTGGLEKVFWNDSPMRSKVCDPIPNHETRPGAEGSFGIYFQDGQATIHAARFFLHSTPGET